MHRTDAPDNIDNLFVQESPGQLATVVDAAWLNAVQEENCNVIEAAAIALEKGNHTQLLAAIRTLASRHGTPTGSVFAFTGTAAPSGYLIANGQAISRTTYAALWAFAQASGNLATDGADYDANPGKYGRGDGATTFQLPKLDGLFIRGIDAAGTVDSEARTIGDYQTDAMQQITGTLGNVQFRSSTFGTGAFTIGAAGSNGNDFSGGDPSRTIEFDSAGSTRTAPETRPKNVAYPFIIKT